MSKSAYERRRPSTEFDLIELVLHLSNHVRCYEQIPFRDVINSNGDVTTSNANYLHRPSHLVVILTSCMSRTSEERYSLSRM